MTRTILGCCCALFLGLATVGCDNGDTDVIDSEPMTEEDVQAADEAYEEEMEAEPVGDE